MKVFGIALSLFFASSLMQAASVTLSPIYVSIGPDQNTSPSYSAYTTNAQAALAAGQSSLGGSIATTPSAYNAIGSGSTVAANGASITNSPFPSWLGVADPGGALTGQLGNMIYWNIVFTGTNISLSQVNVTQLSTDSLDYFGSPGQPGGLFTQTFSSYSSSLVGITSGGAQITSGASTQQVNEIIISGFAAAQDGYGIANSGTDAQKLQQIDNAFATTLGSYAIDTCFYYGTASSSNPNTCDTVDVTNSVVTTSVPEPSSLFLAIPLLLPAGWFLRRRS